jgi:murein L,D-transpeptidase YcbB/YkuD
MSIESKVTGTVLLPQPFPIHMVYFTAFVGSDNQLQMRRDVYGWDKPAIEALKVAIGQ